MIICDYFGKIYKNYANLWIINGVLTRKMFFAADKVVYLLPEPDKNLEIVNLRVFNLLILKHIKNKGIKKFI